MVVVRILVFSEFLRKKFCVGVVTNGKNILIDDEVADQWG
jgi:hypothetical protein